MNMNMNMNMNRKKILIIDDDKRFTDMMKNFLEETGKYEVKVENMASMALEAVGTFIPDLVLLDIIMPGLDGNEVAERIRKSQGGKKIPIVFVSGFFTFEQEEVIGVGNCLLLSKPVRVKKFLEFLARRLWQEQPAV